MLSSDRVDLDNHPTVQLVRKHLVEHLGPPNEVFEVPGSMAPGSPLASLNLAFFSPGGPEAPVLFATCGASLYKMSDGRRVEALVILARQPPAEHFEPLRRLLASFALFAEASGQTVQLGDVVRAEAELAPLCGMDAVLFVPPFTFLPTFHRVALSETEAADVVWLLPVYAAEAEYALQHGPQALMMLLTAQRLDLTDFARPSADCSMSPDDAAEGAQRLTEQAMSASPRPSTTTSGSDVAPTDHHVQAESAEIQMQRRAPKPAQRPRPVRRPMGRSSRPGEDEVRFDLAKDGVTPQRRPIRADPSEPSGPSAAPIKLTKAQRVAALKKAATDARARAKARHAGTASNKPAATITPASDRSPPRRLAPFRRGGTATDEVGSSSRRDVSSRRPFPSKGADRDD